MVSPEQLIRYPFFAGFNHDQLSVLATAGQMISVDEGHYFFYEGDQLDKLYLIVKGKVAINIGVPNKGSAGDVRDHILGNLVMDDIAVSTVDEGQLFGWSAMIPPHESTASAQTITECQVMAFDCHELKNHFQTDCEFAYIMMVKVADVIRQRLRDMHVQSLAFEPT